MNDDMECEINIIYLGGFLHNIDDHLGRFQHSFDPNKKTTLSYPKELLANRKLQCVSYRVN